MVSNNKHLEGRGMFIELSGIAVNGGKHMIRQLIEGYVGKIPDVLFKEAALEATKDVRHNRLVHGSRTCFEYIVYVMVTYIKIAQNIEKSQKQIA